MEYCYKFPVVKGLQAGRPYYIGMVPLKMLSKLFPDDEEYVLPEYRAQRKLNNNRIPEIKKYILINKDNYVFSALAASIDGEFNFVESNIKDIGMLEISMDAKLLMNDGQHRKAAIIAALDDDKSIGKETISVVFYEDTGLTRSQQMFTDLNKHAVKTSNSISELYDSRDNLAVITRNIISELNFYNEYVDKERDILGKYSSALFTLNTFYMANKRILGRKKINDNYQRFLLEYWKTVALHMIPWRELENRELSKIELREQYIATQAVIIQAFGRVGSYLFDTCPDKIEKYISKIEKINWKRNSDIWRLRVIKANGRMINNDTAITLACNVIKTTIGLKLTEDENRQEILFKEMIGKKNE